MEKPSQPPPGAAGRKGSAETMIEARRRAYLEALGFDVWIARPAAPEPGFLCVGAGRGSTLLVCRSVADCQKEVASDLARALGDDPVWSWIDPVADDDFEHVEDVVSSRQIKRVLLLGRETAGCLFEAAPPATLGSARILEAPGLDELGIDPGSKKALWRRLQSMAGTGGAA
jgi:hypothetical protein